MANMFFIRVLYLSKWLIFLAIMMTNGYPLREPELKDETHYPNGSIIGKYTYMDSDGNPIYVKYYADDASYGVELQSKKIIDSSTDETLMKQKNDILKSLDPTFENIELPKDNNVIKNKYKTNINNSKDKTNNKITKSRVEYEVFYQNNLQNPNRCGNDKVKVYLDKHKRIARDALQHQAEKYCEQILG